MVRNLFDDAFLPKYKRASTVRRRRRRLHEEKRDDKPRRFFVDLTLLEDSDAEVEIIEPSPVQDDAVQDDAVQDGGLQDCMQDCVLKMDDLLEDHAMDGLGLESLHHDPFRMHSPLFECLLHDGLQDTCAGVVDPRFLPTPPISPSPSPRVWRSVAAPFCPPTH
jgi:hypothetical protein